MPDENEPIIEPESEIAPEPVQAKTPAVPVINPDHERRTINGREVLWDKRLKAPVIETGVLDAK